MDVFVLFFIFGDIVVLRKVFFLLDLLYMLDCLLLLVLMVVFIDLNFISLVKFFYLSIYF